MDQEQFEKELKQFDDLAEEFKNELANVDRGSTDEQIAATKPRDPELVKKDAAKHEAAAEESALAEARAYMDSAKAIISTLAAASAAG